MQSLKINVTFSSIPHVQNHSGDQGRTQQCKKTSSKMYPRVSSIMPASNMTTPSPRFCMDCMLQTNKQMDGLTNRQTDRQTTLTQTDGHRQTDKHRQRNRQADRCTMLETLSTIVYYLLTFHMQCPGDAQVQHMPPLATVHKPILSN